MFTARSERPRRNAQSVLAETIASAAAITHTAVSVRRTESTGEGSATLSKSYRNRNVQPAANPAQSRIGQGIASDPPKSRAPAAASGNRNAKTASPRPGLHADTSARASDNTSSGRRSRAAGGNPTEKTATNPQTAASRSARRTPPPGRCAGSSIIPGGTPGARRRR
jgi:hypothetical protein